MALDSIFLLDTKFVDMCIIYLEYFHGCRSGATPMTHLLFKKRLCEALLVDWPMRSPHPSNLPPLLQRPKTCLPSHSKQRRQCVACLVKRPYTFYYKCGGKYMCHPEGGYYEHWHIDIARRCACRHWYEGIISLITIEFISTILCIIRFSWSIIFLIFQAFYIFIPKFLLLYLLFCTSTFIG